MKFGVLMLAIFGAIENLNNGNRAENNLRQKLRKFSIADKNRTNEM